MAVPEEYGKNNKPLQSTRQKWILDRLNNGEELSITALAVEWDTSAKTLSRDFDKLQVMLPGQIERASDGKKYRKANNYTAQNDGEIIIEILDSMVRSIGEPTYSKAHKLLTQLKTHIDKPFYTRIDVEDVSDKFDLITKLEKAISQKKSISMVYHRWYDDEQEDKPYENVFPLKIVVYNGFWYLLTEHKGHYKKFYLKEIKSCTIEDKSFEPDQKVFESMENSINIWFSPKTEPFEVTLWLDSDAVVYFKRKPISKKQKLYEKPGDTAELVVKITDEDEIYPVVKHWLPHVRILEPKHMQDKFEAMLRNYLDFPNT